MFQTKLVNEKSYKTSIGGIKFILIKLLESNLKAQKLRAKEYLPDNCKNIKEILHYQSLPLIPKVIRTELIRHHHDNLLADHFGFDKTCELISCKYF